MNRYKIMLVHDEPDILDLLEKALNIEGFYNITKIDNGISAVITCKEIQPDIIILDVMLPDIDGYEVCKQIREFSITVNILMCLRQACMYQDSGMCLS